MGADYLMQMDADFSHQPKYVPDMIAKLNHLGVPVKLAVGLDSVFKTKLSTGAERYINIYIGDGPGEPVKPENGFRGKLEICRMRENHS